MFTPLLAVAFLLPADPPTYWQDIRPVLRKHCTVCHKEAKLKDADVSGGLALDTLDTLRRPAKPVLIPGKPDDSRLVTLLLEKNPKKRMPLDAEPLPAEAIMLIRKWVEAGAPEGTKPAETDVVAPTAKLLRKLPVTFATKAATLTLPVGPLSPVAAVAFSPDGKLLAVGSYGRATVWDLSAAKPSRVVTNVLGAVNDVKFSPDGKQLAVAGGQPSARGDLRLFDVADGKLVASLGGHLDTVSGVAFSPDGTKLASASFDKTVRLWDVKTATVLHTFTGHSDFVYAVAFSPKGDWYATASKDRTSRIIDAKTGQSRLTFSGMDNEVLAVAVRADGTQVVTSGYEPQLHWWDATTGERLRRQAGHNTAVHELAFAAKAPLAVSAGGDRTVRTWNPQTGAQVRSFVSESPAFAVATDPAGKRIASGYADGLTRLWDTEGGRLLLTLWSGQDGWLAITPEGYFAAEGVAGTWSDAKVIAVLKDAKLVAKAAAGEKLPEPKLK